MANHDVEHQAIGAADEVEGFSNSEMLRATYFPHLAIEYVIGKRERLAVTVRDGRGLGPLILLLALCALIFSAPFCVLPTVSGPFKFTNLFSGFLLFTGSMLICFPSLYVFNKFVGFELGLGQSLVMGLVVSAAASIISFGFFPIIWFIGSTTGAGRNSRETLEFISNLLLATAFFMGIIHMSRSFVWSKQLREMTLVNRMVMVAWFMLLSFLTYRMALVLEIL